jgi:hypothetical protein
MLSGAQRDEVRARVLQQQYHLEMDYSSIPRLIDTYGLTL